MLIERVGADLLGNFAAIMNLFDQSVSQFPLQQSGPAGASSRARPAVQIVAIGPGPERASRRSQELGPPRFYLRYDQAQGKIIKMPQGKHFETLLGRRQPEELSKSDDASVLRRQIPTSTQFWVAKHAAWNFAV